MGCDRQWVFFTARRKRTLLRSQVISIRNRSPRSGSELELVAIELGRTGARTPAGPSLDALGREAQTQQDPLTGLDGLEKALPRLPAAELTMVYGSEDSLAQVAVASHNSPALKVGFTWWVASNMSPGILYDSDDRLYWQVTTKVARTLCSRRFHSRHPAVSDIGVSSAHAGWRGRGPSRWGFRGAGEALVRLTATAPRVSARDPRTFRRA